MLHPLRKCPQGGFESQLPHREFRLKNGIKKLCWFCAKLCCNLLANRRGCSQNVLEDISGIGAAQNLKNASQFSTKLAQFFDTIFKSKFAVGGGSQNLLGDISGRGAAQNLKITTHFSTKLTQFFDTILKSKFVMGGLASLEPPAFCRMVNSTKFKNYSTIFWHIFKSQFARGASSRNVLGGYLWRCSTKFKNCRRI